jgi:hypothetical protein
MSYFHGANRPFHGRNMKGVALIVQSQGDELIFAVHGLAQISHLLPLSVEKSRMRLLLPACLPPTTYAHEAPASCPIGIRHMPTEFSLHPK